MTTPTLFAHNVGTHTDNPIDNWEDGRAQGRSDNRWMMARSAEGGYIITTPTEHSSAGLGKASFIVQA